MQGRRWTKIGRPERQSVLRLRLLAVPAILMAGLAGVAAGTLSNSAPAWAINNGNFALNPVHLSPQGREFFAPVLTAGVQSSDKVAVENETTHTLTLDLYTADGYTDPTGSFALEPQFKPRVHMGAWIHLPVNSVTIPAQSGYIIPFTYTPPANVAPGNYAGGIVAVEPQGPTSHKGPLHVQVLQAVGVAVYGRISGPLVPRVAVTKVSVSTTRPFLSQFGGAVDATVTYSITNTGNKNITPSVTVGLSPLIGSGPPKVHVQMKQILPGSTVTLRHTFEHVVPAVILGATVSAKAAGTEAATGSGTAIVIPWALVAILVLLILLMYFRRRRRRAEPKADTGPKEEGDGSPGPTDPTSGTAPGLAEATVGAPGP